MFSAVEKKLIAFFVLFDLGNPGNALESKTIFEWEPDPAGNYHLKADGSSIAKLHVLTNWVYFTGVKKSDDGYLITPDEPMSPLSVSWVSFRRYQVKLETPEFKAELGVAKIRFPMEVFSTSNSVYKFRHETTLAVSLDPDSNFFIYKVDSKIGMAPEVASLFIADQGSIPNAYKDLEFQDILPDGIVEYLPPRTPASKLWKWLVFDDLESQFDNASHRTRWMDKMLRLVGLGYKKRFFKLPLNHHNFYNFTPLKSQKLFFAWENDPNTGNPVILLDHATAKDAFFVLCTWAWDLHFYYALEAAAKKLHNKGSLDVSYTISYQNNEKLRNIYNTAQMSALVETPQFKTPHYPQNHQSDFEPGGEYRSPSDFYFWTFFEQDSKHFLWDLTKGYQSSGSLKIQNDTKQKNVWYFSALGSPYLQGFALDGAYKLSADVQTSTLIGEVEIGLQHIWNSEADARYYSRAITSSTNKEWFKISVQTPKIVGGYARIHLVLNGQGEVWWDNVCLEKLPEVEPIEPQATSP